MQIRTVIIGAICWLLISGCRDQAARSDLQALRAELRDHKFDSAQPKLKVAILKKEVIAAEKDYLGPVLRLTGVVRQEGDFPHARYVVQNNFSADVPGQEPVTLYSEARMNEKTGAFTADTRLAVLGAGALLPRPSAITVKLKYSGWYLEREWQKDVTLEIAPEAP